MLINAYPPVQNLADLIAATFGEFICQLPSTLGCRQLGTEGQINIYFSTKDLRESDLYKHQKVILTMYLCSATIKDGLPHASCHFDSCICCSTKAQHFHQQVIKSKINMVLLKFHISVTDMSSKYYSKNHPRILGTGSFFLTYFSLTSYIFSFSFLVSIVSYINYGYMYFLLNRVIVNTCA